MNWTKEPPTEPGWYWWRKSGAALIIRVGEMVGFPQMSHVGFPVMPTAGEEWAGPISEPGEVEE
jgi:hypothetical protein